LQKGAFHTEKGVVDKDGVLVKEISTNEKKPSPLHENNRKDALRTSQKLSRPHPLQLQGYAKVKMHLKDFLLRRQSLWGKEVQCYGLIGHLADKGMN
jgi:hypothetical protein